MPKVDEEYLQARRRQIMDAAVACFSREGFHRATMQAIIQQTGLSAGAIYRYFESKEDIVAAVAEEHHAPEAAVLADADSADDAAELLRRLVAVSLGRLTNAAERRWRRVTIQLWSEALRDGRIMKIVRSGLDGPVEQLAAVIRRGQREGAIVATLDAKAAAQVCASIFQGLVLQQAWDPSIDVGAYVDAALAILQALAPSHRRRRDGRARQRKQSRAE